MKRLAVVLVPMALAFGVMSSGVSASTQADSVHVQKVVGPYQLTFQIGPAEKMSMHKKGATGEVMLGGKMPSCADSGSPMGGMSMGSNTCNRHIEVHVVARKTERVITTAQVTISLSNLGTHQTLHVPIMTMVGATGGPNDVHYGNNLRAAPGAYIASVRINHVSATFAFHLN